ncbi:MAG TPA: DUF6348 family protein [Actinocrinis sp.]|nr:DUF6348 family protein [Actinocrinis sp.]
MSDDAFLALVREALSTVAPELIADSAIKDGVLAASPGWSVTVRPNHTGRRDHYDLAVVPDTSAEPAIAVVDCAQGSGKTAHQAAERAVDQWLRTAGMCVLEMFDRRGRFAEHVGGSDPFGVPGWFAVMSGVTGYGFSVPECHRLQRWFVRNRAQHAIAGVLDEAMRGRSFAGVTFFYGGPPEDMEAEVRIDGERHAAASAALAALDWPVVECFTAIRSYTVFVPETEGAPGSGGLDGGGEAAGRGRSVYFPAGFPAHRISIGASDAVH